MKWNVKLSSWRRSSHSRVKSDRSHRVRTVALKILPFQFVQQRHCVSPTFLQPTTGPSIVLVSTVSGFSYRVFSNGLRAILHDFGAVPPAVGAGDAVDGGHLSCVLHDSLLHLAQMFHLLLIELYSVQVRLLCCVQETIRPKCHPRQLKAAFASAMFRLWDFNT